MKCPECKCKIDALEANVSVSGMMRIKGKNGLTFEPNCDELAILMCPECSHELEPADFEWDWNEGSNINFV